MITNINKSFIIINRQDDKTQKIMMSCYWHEKPYKTTIIFGGRQGRFIFRDPRYKLATWNRHPFICRYCDCPGYIYSTRKNIKIPKHRQECKHVYHFLSYLDKMFLGQELSQSDKSILDMYEKDLSSACTQYIEAIDAQEEWGHKKNVRDNVVRTREIYHKIQESCTRELSNKPILYAHATQESYPHIHQIK